MHMNIDDFETAALGLGLSNILESVHIFKET